MNKSKEDIQGGLSVQCDIQTSFCRHRARHHLSPCVSAKGLQAGICPGVLISNGSPSSKGDCLPGFTKGWLELVMWGVYICTGGE